MEVCILSKPKGMARNGEGLKMDGKSVSIFYNLTLYFLVLENEPYLNKLWHAAGRQQYTQAETSICHCPRGNRQVLPTA